MLMDDGKVYCRWCVWALTHNSQVLWESVCLRNFSDRNIGINTSVTTQIVSYGSLNSPQLKTDVDQISVIASHAKGPDVVAVLF